MVGKLRTVVLDTSDIKGLASFYTELAGLSEQYADDGWITLSTSAGHRLGFQQVEDHVPPRWPDSAHPQQMHLDLLVPDLDAAVARAIELGATRLPGGAETYTVLADPSGHPFCLCYNDGVSQIDIYEVAIDCPDGAALAAFYAELLGLEVSYSGPEGAQITADGELPVMFQTVADYQAPRWPDPAYPQQFHLDVLVTDVDEAEAKVLALGARKLPGGGDHYRVYADPVGHPFCLVWHN